VARAATGATETFHASNLPLGIYDGEIFDQLTIPFAAGDVFLFYSDGITDVRNATGQLFGRERLAACLSGNRHLDADALGQAIRSAAMAFAASDSLGDDLTCVVLKAAAVQKPLARADLEIRSDLSDLARARAFVRDFCAGISAGCVDRNDVAALELAVNEAASNVMKHAYRGRTDQRIVLDAEAFPDHLILRLHHLGESFDPATAPPPALDGSRESGFGLYLISRTVDDVRYGRNERGWNSITLIKRVNLPDARTNRCH